MQVAGLDWAAMSAIATLSRPPAPPPLPAPSDPAEARCRRLRLRFGSLELDAARFELRRDGTRIPLAPQPWDLLWLLASREGALVTRAEIRHLLWGTETFVDFDGSVNFTVRALRQALGADAREPRFIASVRGRGYRFLAAVEVIAPTL